ncbi:MAG: PIN domain-containing protein [Cyanobacteria bacterium P01_A01_bin.116]
MLRQVIVDTSALVASIDQSESHHEWVVQQLEQTEPPLLTCEAVISETWFLLGRVRGAREAFLPYLEQGQVKSCSL